MIEVENLRFSYGSVEALRGVSFRLQPGEICGYLGRNGAGKSTTVKSLVGILRPAQGTIRICGYDVSEFPLEAKQRVGYVPETAAAFSLLNVWEYLELVAELYAVPRALQANRIRSLVARFDLDQAAHRCLDTLSKGQRQKAIIAAALLHEPQVLILDEPLNGLDAHSARLVKGLMLQLAKEGRTILFCSHVMEVVERVCNRIIILKQGEIVVDAPTSDLVARSGDRSLDTIFQDLTAGHNPAPADLSGGTARDKVTQEK